MAIAYKTGGSATNDASATSIAAAFGTNNTAGSLLVAAISWSAGGLANAPTSVTDTRGNAWTLYGTPIYDVPNAQGLTFAYATNCAAGANTVTANFGTTTDYRRIIVDEYSGIAIASPLDGVASNIATNNTSTDNVTSTALTTTVNGNLIWGVAQKDNGFLTTANAGTGFTSREYISNDMITEDQVQTSAGSLSATWTFGNNTGYLAFGVGFKAAAAASTNIMWLGT